MPAFFLNNHRLENSGVHDSFNFHSTMMLMIFDKKGDIYAHYSRSEVCVRKKAMNKKQTIINM